MHLSLVFNHLLILLYDLDGLTTRQTENIDNNEGEKSIECNISGEWCANFMRQLNSRLCFFHSIPPAYTSITFRILIFTIREFFPVDFQFV